MGFVETADELLRADEQADDSSTVRISHRLTRGAWSVRAVNLVTKEILHRLILY